MSQFVFQTLYIINSEIDVTLPTARALVYIAQVITLVQISILPFLFRDFFFSKLISSSFTN